jgi:Domain of Unknown Function (DUF928)
MDLYQTRKVVMFYKYFHRYIAIFAIASFLQMIGFSVFLADVYAQKNKQIEPPEDRRGAPPTTLGGGARTGGDLFVPPTKEPVSTIAISNEGRNSDGSCAMINRNIQPQDRTKKAASIVPLLPPNNFGLTVSSNPTFFAYIPKTSAIAVEFTLKNQKERRIYQQRVSLTTSPSIVSFRLPITKFLEVRKDYKWLISLVCESGKSKDNFSEGIIRRVIPDPELIEKLENASPIDRVILYAKFGIWHEALAEIVKLRLSEPSNDDLNAIWLDLLKSANSESLVNTPLKN